MVHVAKQERIPVSVSGEGPAPDHFFTAIPSAIEESRTGQWGKGDVARSACVGVCRIRGEEEGV